MQDETENCRKTEEKVCKDRISALPEDLLVTILLFLQTKDAVATAILSKRWRSVWKMLPRLEYIDPYDGERRYKSVGYFLDKSLQLHKAPLLERLRIRLCELCPVAPNVGKWVLDAVNRCVQDLNLEFHFRESAKPTILPKSLYTCKTLVELTLSGKILVDVPSPACLPFLQTLDLTEVVYKDQDTHVRLLSSCPVLKVLVVFRDPQDNMTCFRVKVPSLQRLTYEDYDRIRSGSGRSLAIDSPGLRYLKIDDYHSVDNYSSHDLPRLEVAFISRFDSHRNYKFMTCLSSVMFLNLVLTEVQFPSTINFSRLIELKLSPCWSANLWLESLMHLLHNSPKLKVLLIDSTYYGYIPIPISWNQPSSVPECLLCHLEIFEWKTYRGSTEEKQFVAYVLANSKFLKTVEISPGPFSNNVNRRLEMEDKMKEELESMYRVSSSSQLMVTLEDRERYRDRESYRD